MFEIRVGVLGYVSVGKTTLINALFGDEYGQVSMSRTTAVVNSFRVGSHSQDAMAVKSEADSEDDSVELVTKKLSASATLTATKKLSASATLKETTTDNAAFRNSNIVKEKVYNIALEEPLHNMRPDTKLVIVDIPGINEAGTSSKYRDYVNDKWHTFDIVVVVMDATKGVNTEEQLDLLKLVKENLTSSKDVPVIILANKVDDPHKKALKALLDEVREATTKIFGVSDRETALQSLLKPKAPTPKKKTRGNASKNLFPAVVPISAMHAFLYRCGSRLSFDEFCKMDDEFIENIGSDFHGKKWYRLNRKEQLKKSYEAVSQEDQCRDGLEDSNFDTFVKVLAHCIGDKGNQTLLIERQVEVALKRMKQPSPTCDLGEEVLSAHSKLVSLGKPVDHLPATFWASYKGLKKEAIDSLKSTFSPKSFAAPIGQLCNYRKALCNLQWPGELEEVLKCSKELALEYAVMVVESEDLKKMSKSDQSLVLGSMLCCSKKDAFNLHFEFLRLYMEAKYLATVPSVAGASGSLKRGKCPCASCSGTLLMNNNGQGAHYCGSCGKVWIDDGTTTCPTCIHNGWGSRSLSQKCDSNGNKTSQCSHYNCNNTFYIARPHFCQLEMKVKDGKLVPDEEDDDAYNKCVTVVVPDSVEDPNHFGHVFWKCCELLKDVESEAF